jgi:PleD family two-component response regulator
MSASALPVQNLERTTDGGAKPQTVLVVDDEASMRDYLHRVLLQGGYQCKCFSDGLELLSYLGEEGNDVGEHSA